MAGVNEDRGQDDYPIRISNGTAPLAPRSRRHILQGLFRKAVIPCIVFCCELTTY
jgi:hypothetical protein